MLRAGEVVRAWLSADARPLDRHHDPTSSPREWGAWEMPSALVPLHVRRGDRARRRPAAARSAVDGRRSTRRSTRSTASSSPAAPTSTRRTYGAGAASRDDRHACPSATRGELALLTAALERDMPVLAVCRGSQVLNVARGGDLVQHLPEVVGARAAQARRRACSRSTASRSSREPRSAAILGERAPVKSHHHQGFGRIGEGLREVGVGRGRDGRGARGPVEALRARRALAPGGGRGRARSSRRSSSRRGRTARGGARPTPEAARRARRAPRARGA